MMDSDWNNLPFAARRMPKQLAAEKAETKAQIRDFGARPFDTLTSNTVYLKVLLALRELIYTESGGKRAMATSTNSQGEISSQKLSR